MAACYGSLRKLIQSPEQNSGLKLKVLSPQLSVSKAELLISYKDAQIESLVLMEYGHTHTHTTLPQRCDCSVLSPRQVWLNR